MQLKQVTVPNFETRPKYQISDQSNLVELIIQRVLREPSSSPLGECKHPVGIDFHINKLLSLLNIDSNGVRFVAICGMGGLGKTTIAKAIYNCIFKSFNGSSFITDVREEALQGDKALVSLQNRLLKDILKRDHDVNIISQGSELIKRLLHGKKVLLILDDVDDHVQLDVLAGGINWFGEGSRVIITTRDDQSLNAHKADKDIQIYKPDGLNFENSLQLLSLYAFSKNEPPKKYKQLSHKIVQYAEGLPLTLEVLGSFLFGKEKEEWEDTLEGLKDILENMVSGMSIQSYDEKVVAKLMISYNKLSDHAKIIFLDIACHFIGFEAENINSIWEACDLRPRLAIKELTQKHLLKIEASGALRMHDQLKFMGRRIVSKGSHGDPAKRTRLWSEDEILKVLEKGTGTQMVEGILLPREVHIDDLSFEDFEKMPNLRILEVDNIYLSGDFSRLPSRLRWLSWWSCPLEVLPTNFYHEELVHLDLTDSRIKLAWNDKPQNKNKRFKKLKVLILEGCSHLSDSPDFFSWFPCLQRLDLTGCSSLLELPDSICQMASLKTLILKNCFSIKKLPTSIGNLKHLVKLSLSGTKFEELPDGVGQLDKLEELDVSDCHELVKLPISMGRMRSLLHFDLRDTMILKLPDNFSKVSSLEGLRMRMVELDDQTDYKRPQPLPISMSGFPSQLQELYLEGYMNLQSLLELPSTLTRLEVKKCISLQIILDLSHLERLKELLLYDCKSLVRIRLHDLSNLKKLKVKGCSKLRELGISNCENVKISNCENLEEIHRFEGANSLKKLFVQGCHKLIDTTRKIQGQGRLLVDNVCEGDHHIYQVQGSPILCVVFSLTSGRKVRQIRKTSGIVTIDLEISAHIRWGVERTLFRCSIRIEDIEFTNEKDIIYIHHFKGFDWFGFPLKCKDAIEELHVEVSAIYRHPGFPFLSYCMKDAHVKLCKVLFENKESEQRMRNQQSSAMLVADFFTWSDSDVDDEEVEEEEDADEEVEEEYSEDDEEVEEEEDSYEEVEENADDNEEVEEEESAFRGMLFENKESEQQMPNQHSSAMLVADFFRWSDDEEVEEEDPDNDDEVEEEAGALSVASNKKETCLDEENQAGGSGVCNCFVAVKAVWNSFCNCFSRGFL
ncbi:disease resistance protein RUN1-like isoform X2 [Macadamia integrifolia]|uniref:disease resistance protein RUN1-like isoform X2 n=2 Tax=Macadamia integrifolia TaxID=60698 RepID=UPI001C4F5E40|nr:disease resistance protein RUN1-like isoform X2 [Macadamia integrifolia]